MNPLLDPDSKKKVMDPDPAGQKSTDPDPHPCISYMIFKYFVKSRSRMSVKNKPPPPREIL